MTTRQPVVVSDDGSGPQLCFGSYSFGGPPDCSDAAVPGWDWTEHAGAFEESNGVRWGSFLLTGTFDGESFEPTDVDPPSSSPYTPDFSIPCPEPAGGWQVEDPARATREQLTSLSSVAEDLPDHALTAVSTVEGAPGPRDPAETVVTSTSLATRRVPSAHCARCGAGCSASLRSSTRTPTSSASSSR
ncbi:hypothetical protein [Nocardioides sp. CF8]|uniref:hypothetical protein n=1 Tax=Nocardioides sp. CF8 TaxID=110319 RepID=UPI0018DBC2E6|nr:hypothetical protein [Nocardioides sp. CF8]